MNRFTKSSPVTVKLPATCEESALRIFGEVWKRFHPRSRILYASSVLQAIITARELGEEGKCMHTLITGSQHLVGAALFHFS
jgi:folylpolyglutamate synthase